MTQRHALGAGRLQSPRRSADPVALGGREAAAAERRSSSSPNPRIEAGSCMEVLGQAEEGYTSRAGHNHNTSACIRRDLSSCTINSINFVNRNAKRANNIFVVDMTSSIL